MGTNSKARRAAKQRKRSPVGEPSRPSFEEPAAYQRAEQLVSTTARRIARESLSESALLRETERLERALASVPAYVVQQVLGDLLARLTDAVTAGGWGPGDLVELVSRGSGPRHLPTLLTTLYDESRRNPVRGSAWLEAVAALGDDPRLRFTSTERLASGLQVAAVLAGAPLLDATQLLAAEDDVAPHPKLARVRALLAKAESTEFDEEAEALTAKAQELISRYALGQLLGSLGASVSSRQSGLALVTRRIWLEAPYVRAKGSLVHHVASANHAQAALSERHGFSLVVGARHDVDAVDLLVSSLLVQATRAVLRHGRREDGFGTSRTRSYRQAFLYAYAARIGERLRESAETATAPAVDGSTAEGAPTAEQRERLLPVLRDHDERVTRAFGELLPNTTSRQVRISNGEGYAAGLVAADLAQLDVNAQIREQTG